MQVDEAQEPWQVGFNLASGLLPFPRILSTHLLWEPPPPRDGSSQTSSCSEGRLWGGGILVSFEGFGESHYLTWGQTLVPHCPLTPMPSGTDRVLSLGRGLLGEAGLGLSAQLCLGMAFEPY